MLGIPLRDYFVRLDQLKTYGPQIKPETLFQRSPEVVYPILVGSRTVSSMTLAEHDDAFTVATLGSSGLVVALAATREAVAKAQNVPQRAFFIVRVPALGLVYLGHEMPDGFYLTTVNPRVANSPGVSSERAEVVLQRLVPLAQGLRDDAPS